MEFILLTDAEKEKFRDEIFNMLVESDNDFFPPLSKRYPTNSETSDMDSIKAYFASVMHEKILATVIDGRLAGIVTFLEDLKASMIPDENNIYLMTVLVASSARGKGVLTRSYEHLFNVLYKHKSIYTRTWSTNHAHTKVLLDKFGFEEIKRLPNDRGEGVDTVYFGLKR